MAKKRRSSAASGKKRTKAAPALTFGWRLLLIPLSLFLWNVLPAFEVETLEFARHVMDFWGRGEFTLNFILLAVSVIGLVGLILTPARRTLPEALWFILLLAPVWVRGTTGIDSEYLVSYLSGIDTDIPVLLCGALLSLWALVPVRGEGRVGLRILIAAVLIAGNVLLMYPEGDRMSRWEMIFTVLSVASIAGCAVDWVNGGPCLQSILPAAAGSLKALLPLTDMSSQMCLWVIGLVSAAFAVVLLVRGPAQKRSYGGIASLAGFAVCAASALIGSGMI